MGYGNLRVSNMVEPALSTVESPLREMGFQGTRLLIDLLEKRPIAQPRVLLAPHLVARASCAPMARPCRVMSPADFSEDR
jgi:DNA-binding LacI/PurR family transcriptional regulator